MSNYDEFIRQIDREAYHENEVRWEEDGFTVTRSNHWSAPGCHNSCGFLLYEKDGKLDHVEGDPLSPFVNGKLCMRCLNLDESCNDPMRLKYPMRRIGERGKNKWERITWDEALDIIEEKWHYYQDTYGPHSIAVLDGTGRNVGWPVPVLGYLALKCPTANTLFFTGFSCYLPRVLSCRALIGDYFISDAAVGKEKRYADEEWRAPGVVIVWANEPLKSNADGYIGHWLVECMQLGTKIISVDPRLTWWGVHAEHFLQLRPGTDAALAMAMLNVIISESIYDANFVDLWCYGFEELCDAVKDSTPEWAAEICDLNADDIRAAARMFATEGPGTIQWGLAFEQQASCMGLNTAAIDLMSICGYIDVPGGGLIVRNAFDLSNTLSEKYMDKELLSDKGFTFDDNNPFGNTREITWHIEDHHPKRIRFAWMQSTNPIACCGIDAPRIYDVMKQTEFVVSADPYITPSAVAFADILLPVAMSPERNSVRTWWTPLRSQTKAYQYYEAKTDEEICLLVGKRLNPEKFIWETDRDIVTWRLCEDDSFVPIANPHVDNQEDEFNLQDTMYSLSGNRWTGTLEDLENMGGFCYDGWNATYKKYEKGMLRTDKTPGFDTPTGRLELISNIYGVWHLNPKPYFIEPLQSPISTPELYDKYPLIMVTGGRSYEFFHSEHRQLKTMREFHPWPLITINPKTAKKYGVKNGDWVWIENDQGRFRQVAFISPTIKEYVIHCEHAWWFPEQEGAEPYLFGTFDSNPNNLINHDLAGPGGIASPIKNTLVRIYPFKEGDILPGEQVCALGGFDIQKARREAYQKTWPDIQ